MKQKVTNGLQRFSRALFMPVLILPMVGLMIAVANLFTNPRLMEALPFLDNPITFGFGSVLSAALLPILTHLSLIFCLGIALGLANQKKAEAAFTAVLSFLIFVFAMNKYLDMQGILVEPHALIDSGQTVVLGVQILDMGILPGIILGSIVAWVHNRLITIKFKNTFQIFSGARFVVIILIPLLVLLAILFSSIWPFIQSGIDWVGELIYKSGNLGLFLYGSLDRLLMPTGLHHLVYTPFLYTSLGGVQEVAGTIYEGARNIYLAEITDPAVSLLSQTVNFDARGITKMFGLMGASLAMFHTAKPQNKSQVRTLLIPAALASFMAGVTEPLEFSFLFVSPLLFGVHCLLSGLSLLAVNVLGSRAIGPNGLIDFILYNLPLGIEKTRWPIYIFVGLAIFLIYYLVFRFLITRFDLKTIGRGEEVKLHTEADFKQNQAEPNDGEEKVAPIQSSAIDITLLVEGLGGHKNIKTIDNCYSRLRLTVKDPSLLNEEILNKQIEAKGVVQNDENIQLVYGLEVTKVREDLDNYLDNIMEE